jgi:hypothetical protein
VFLGKPALGINHRGTHDVLQHMELVRARRSRVCEVGHRARALQTTHGVRRKRHVVCVEVRIPFPKSRHCSPPVRDYCSSTPVMKRKCTTHITRALFYF